MAKIKSGKFADFTPTKRNSNKHTMKGMRSLDSSMSEDGYTAPMTAAADGEIIDGDARFETSGNRFNDDVIVIEHDGSKPIVAVRTDIKDAEAPAARRIHYRANLTAWQNLEMDSQVVIEDIKEFDFDFEAIGVGLDEIGDLLERDIEGLLNGDDYTELENELEELEGFGEVNITITVASKYEEAVKNWLAFGEVKTSPGMGKGVLKRCELL